MLSEEFNNILDKVTEERRQAVIVNSGITPLSLLGIVFIILKLIGTISWSWWWVLAPFWIPLCLAIILVVFMFVLFGMILRTDEEDIKVKDVAVEKATETKPKNKVVKSKTSTKKKVRNGEAKRKNAEVSQ